MTEKGQVGSRAPAHLVTRNRPHQIDPVEDADLDGIYSGLAKPIVDGKPLYWGLMASVIQPSWSPPNQVFGAGPDWQAIFKADGHNVPAIAGGQQSPRTVARRPNRPTVWLLVDTGKTTLNDARDIGRLAVQSLLGLLQLKLPRVRMTEILWEGALNPRNKLSTVVGQEYAAPKVSEHDLKSDLQDLSKVSPRKLPDYVALSLRWYARAWIDRNRIDRFVHLWLAAVVLIDHGYSRSQRNRVRQKQRIDEYVDKFLAVSQTRRSQLALDLKASYDLRNEIEHEAKIANLNEPAVAKLEESVTEILRLELEALP